MYIDSMDKGLSLEDEVSSIISLYSNGKIEEALRNIDRYIKINPKEAILYNIKGACYSELGELKKAVNNYEIALSINPNGGTVSAGID